MRMIKPPGMIEGGTIRLGDTLLSELTEDEIRRVRPRRPRARSPRGDELAESVMRIKDQILDGIRWHQNGETKQGVLDRLPELLATVGLRPNVLSLYPHELSGGMKTTRLHRDRDLARTKADYLPMTDERSRRSRPAADHADAQQGSKAARRHDSLSWPRHGAHGEVCRPDRRDVRGKAGRSGSVRDIFKEPLHPYTQLLISSLPSLDAKRDSPWYPGHAAIVVVSSIGCVFHPRCPKVFSPCSVDIPALREVRPGRWVSCIFTRDEVLSTGGRVNSVLSTSFDWEPR